MLLARYDPHPSSRGYQPKHESIFHEDFTPLKMKMIIICVFYLPASQRQVRLV